LSGLFFLIVYVCISAFSVIACCMCLNHRKDYANEPETFRRMLNVFMTCRSLAIAMRVLLVVVIFNSLVELRLQFEDAASYADTADYFGDAAYYDAGVEP